MQDVLRELFDEFYEGRLGSHPMTEEERAVWDMAQMKLGGDTIDKLIHAQSRSLSEGLFDSFRMGFHLGALLMLELR